jgi:salicylate hydroxylase
MSASSDPILIAGAGIGGLCAALALLRAGQDVRVLEQAPELGEVGAGLTVQPSATRAVDFLGLGDDLREVADMSGQPYIFHYRTGEQIGEITGVGKVTDENGVSWYHRIHRADFHAMLVDAIRALSPGAIRLNARVSGVEQDEVGVSVTLENGEVLKGRALIGADGSRSTVRNCLFDTRMPQFRGQVAYRSLIPMERVAHLLEDHPAGTYVGPGAIFNRYPVRQGKLLNCIGIVETADWTEEGWACPATRAEFLEKFAGWHESLTGLIREAPEEGLFKWALYDREPLAEWTKGRITLLGDAAHPILPFLGLAGAMAVEDGVVLGRAISATPDDLPGAFARYEAARKPRTDDIFEKSREQGRIFQDPDTDGFASKKRPHSDKTLFAYDPATVAI